MANLALMMSPFGPGAVAKVTPSGFLGPVGVEGAASVGVDGPAEVGLFGGVGCPSCFSSKLQLLPMITSRTSTQIAARARAAFPGTPFCGSFFGVSGEKAQSLVQFLPSKYRCNPWPTPAGSGYHPGADLGGGGACSDGILTLSSPRCRSATRPDCRSKPSRPSRPYGLGAGPGLGAGATAFPYKQS